METKLDYCPREVGEMYGIPERLIRAWVRAGKLPARVIQRGNAISYRISHADAVALAGRVRPSWILAS